MGKYPISVKPKVYVRENVYVHKGDLAKFDCLCLDGYPSSTITWTFTKCKPTPEWPNCEATHRMIGVNSIKFWQFQYYMLERNDKCGRLTSLPTCTRSRTPRIPRLGSFIWKHILTEFFFVKLCFRTNLPMFPTTRTCPETILRYNTSMIIFRQRQTQQFDESFNSSDYLHKRVQPRGAEISLHMKIHCFIV